MALGIDINVNSQQVKDARSQIDLLSRSINDTDTLGDLTIGAGASQEVKQLSEQINNLKNITRSGDTKGGILSKEQFADVQKSMTLINKSVQDYARQVATVKNEFKSINEEQRKLAMLKFNGTASTEDLNKFRSNKQRISELREEEQKLESNRKRITHACLLYTSPSPRDGLLSRMPSSA